MEEEYVMNLELKSLRHDTLELGVKGARPYLKVGELDLGDEFMPWHCQWQNMIITKFVEPYEIVKGRIKKFYEDENLQDTYGGVAIRKPGTGRLFNEHEEWELDNTKIIGCKFDDRTKQITLEVAYDGVRYKTKETI